MVNHTKERCTSCGVWKSRSGACYQCSPMPNRVQAKRAQLTSPGVQRRLELANAAFHPSPQRTKERCPSCGVWKSLAKDCYHCAPMPNRMQAAEARAKVRVEPAPVSPLRTKERCTSCGVWKSLDAACYQCAPLPNRAQVAASIGPTTIVGSPSHFGRL